MYLLIGPTRPACAYGSSAVNLIHVVFEYVRLHSKFMRYFKSINGDSQTQQPNIFRPGVIQGQNVGY